MRMRCYFSTEPCTYLQLMLACLFLSSSTLISLATTSEIISTNPHRNIQCIGEEREALLQFKQGIQSDPCGALDSWTDEECCLWQGIVCNNESGHVISLDLGFFCHLTGSVSPSLVQLKHLEYLNLSNNDFQGQPIPTFIASIHTLKHLRFSNANFGAEIPRQLANLSSLILLDLSGNYDSYSRSLGWLSRLTLLRDINLQSVNLSQAIDWIQTVNNLPSLESVQLDYSSLPSTLPRSLSYVNSSTTLRVLSLSKNVLNGSSVLSWVANLTRKSANHLEYLDLSNNRIQGPLPSAFGNLRSISYLSLANNKLEGLIPRSIFGLKLLEKLDLSENNFQGIEASTSRGHLCSLQELTLFMNNITIDFSRILEVFSGCVNKSLVSLDVSYNRLWGSIPDLIGSFSSLQTLSLGANQLDGTISPSLGLLSKLNSLDLSNNSLRYISEHHFSNLSSLGILALSDNLELVVNISSNWVPPFQLGLIFLRSCNLGPYFPKWLLTQRQYTVLDISNARLHDTIPVSFWKSLPPTLWQLNMSHNEIFGTIPNLSNTFHIVLDLSSNNIEGVIPSFFGDAIMLLLNNNKFSGSIAPLCSKTKVNLQILDLSNNFLSEQLPDCWADAEILSILRLDSNNFTGELPSTIGTLNKLIFFSLRKNAFTGELQMSLFKNWTSLVILDMAYNSFTGYIPEGIGNLKSIQILDFQRNNISGRLPMSLCQLTSLQILDFSFNHITGTIPGCICNLLAMANSANNISYTRGGALIADTFYYAITQMITWKTKERSFSSNLGLVRSIAISDNKLEGQIPSGISCLKCLTSLDLARNNLTGPIPRNIGDMASLEFLDLSQNRLSGEIPSSLASLTFLGTLDLSYNNLSGKIPTGTQLQGMTTTAYVGNPGLCGPPLVECVKGDQAANMSKGDNYRHEEDKGDSIIFPGLCISVLLGFIVGFWGVCGTLVIKRSWRDTHFLYVEHIFDKFYAKVGTIPRIWRKP